VTSVGISAIRNASFVVVAIGSPPLSWSG